MKPRTQTTWIWQNCVPGDQVKILTQAKEHSYSISWLGAHIIIFVYRSFSETWGRSVRWSGPRWFGAAIRGHDVNGAEIVCGRAIDSSDYSACCLNVKMFLFASVEYAKQPFWLKLNNKNVDMQANLYRHFTHTSVINIYSKSEEWCEYPRNIQARKKPRQRAKDLGLGNSWAVTFEKS